MTTAYATEIHYLFDPSVDFKDFMEDPRARIPGTKKAMFGGVKSQDTAENIWTYVKQFNVDGSKK